MESKIISDLSTFFHIWITHIWYTSDRPPTHPQCKIQMQMSQHWVL